jgi:hypothetical protein
LQCCINRRDRTSNRRGGWASAEPLSRSVPSRRATARAQEAPQTPSHPTGRRHPHRCSKAVIRAHAVRSCRRGCGCAAGNGRAHGMAPDGSLAAGPTVVQTTDEPRACARVCLFVRGTVRRRFHDAVVRADHAKPGTKRPPHLQQQGHATCNKYTESSGQRAALQRTTCNMQHGEVGAQRPSHRDIARRLRHDRKPALALQNHKQPPARTHLLRHSLPCASAAAGGAPTRCVRPSPLRQNPARVRVQRVPAAAAQSGCHNRA